MQYIPCTNNRIGHNGTRDNRHTNKKYIKTYTTHKIYISNITQKSKINTSRRKIKNLYLNASSNSVNRNNHNNKVGYCFSNTYIMNSATTNLTIKGELIDAIHTLY